MFIPVLLLAPIGVSLQFSLTHIVPGFAPGLMGVPWGSPGWECG